MIIDITTKNGRFQTDGTVSLYGGNHDTIKPSFTYGASNGATHYLVSDDYCHEALGAASAWVQHYGHVVTCFGCWQGVRLGRQVAKGIILLPLAGATPSVVPPAQAKRDQARQQRSENNCPISTSRSDRLRFSGVSGTMSPTPWPCSSSGWNR